MSLCVYIILEITIVIRNPVSLSICVGKHRAELDSGESTLLMIFPRSIPSLLLDLCQIIAQSPRPDSINDGEQ